MAEHLDEDTLKDTLESIAEPLNTKVENTAYVIKSLENNIDSIDSEIKRLTAMKSTQRNNITRLKTYIQESMETIGEDKIKGELITVSIQNNPQSVNVINDKLISDSFYIEQPKKLDKRSLLQELKNGTVIAGAELQQTRSLRIK